VEDDPGAAEFLGTVVASIGQTFVIARNVADARAHLDKKPFDLVLLALRLPDGEGLEVARHIAERGYRVPVVALSAASERWDESAYAPLGVHRFIPKPCRVKDLLDEIARS
jgi:DNA-binding response OmpR family regulator